MEISHFIIIPALIAILLFWGAVLFGCFRRNILATILGTFCGFVIVLIVITYILFNSRYEIVETQNVEYFTYTNFDELIYADEYSRLVYLKTTPILTDEKTHLERQKIKYLFLEDYRYVWYINKDEFMERKE